MDLPLTDNEQNSASSNRGDSAEDVNIRLNEDQSIIASNIALNGVQVIQFASILLGINYEFAQFINFAMRFVDSKIAQQFICAIDDKGCAIYKLYYRRHYNSSV